MKKIVISLFMIMIGLFLIFSKCTRPQRIELVVNGRSSYKIFVDSSASATDLKAARKLRHYIKEISGAEIPIIVYNKEPFGSAIWIGSRYHAENFPLRVDWDRLGEDGFTIKTAGNNLIIAGGSEKGSLYGVYTFLEDYLVCRKYSSQVTIIPRKETIRLQKIKKTQIPIIEYREIHMPDAMDSSYAEWHKLDSRWERIKKWGMWVHTFDDLVPPDKYFKTHPEYFSMINGSRVPSYQLCLSNPDVLEIVVKTLKRMIKEKPEALIWSVSQNDTYGPCQCDSCLALDRKYGGPSGTMIYFVNRVAEQFPDKIISTLAYQYTRSAPRGIRPRENVNIVLCSIECNRSRPISKDPLSRSFCKDIKGWAGLTNNILIWDYVVQFRSLVSPFPNLMVLKPNIKFFVKNNARMIFEQGSGFTRSEFHELRTYLIAKLLWNPDLNVDRLIEDFLNGFYGDAAPYIKKYIELMHRGLKRSGKPLLIYGSPWKGMDGYLSPELMDNYSALFDKAEAAVSNKPELLKRVRTARLPLEYAILEQAKRYGMGERGLFYKSENEGWKVKPEMKARLNRFVSMCKERGFTLIEEHGYTPDDYLKDMTRFFKRNMPQHLALFCDVTLLTEPSPKYPAGGASALTDGLRGLEDYNCNWLGFEGNDLKAVIDLGEVKTINTITADFLQDIVSWVFLPARVIYEISIDGKNFEECGVVENRISERRGGKFIESFCARLNGRMARYIRVSAENIKKCPDWHIGRGGKAWIFTDEIIVN